MPEDRFSFDRDVMPHMVVALETHIRQIESVASEMAWLRMQINPAGWEHTAQAATQHVLQARDGLNQTSSRIGGAKRELQLRIVESQGLISTLLRLVPVPVPVPTPVPARPASPPVRTRPSQRVRIPPQPPQAQPPHVERMSEAQLKDSVLGENNGASPSQYGDGQCVTWARHRRLSLGGSELPATSQIPGHDGLGASNFTRLPGAQEVTSGNVSQVLGTLHRGSILVWPATESLPYGHVAVIEQVQEDGVWISQANWEWTDEKGNPHDDYLIFVPKEKLVGRYIVP